MPEKGFRLKLRRKIQRSPAACWVPRYRERSTRQCKPDEKTAPGMHGIRLSGCLSNRWIFRSLVNTRPDNGGPPKRIADNSRKGIVVAPVGSPPVISLATRSN